MKTFFRIIARIFGKLIYVSTSFLIAILLTGGLFAYAGFYYYDGYYKDYMAVQQSWAEVDEGFTNYINIVEDNLNLISTEVNKTTFKNEEEKTNAQNKIKFLNTNMANAMHSMTYNDKFSTYPQFLNATEDILFLISNSKDEKTKGIAAELNSIKGEIIKTKKTYNQVATDFNKRNEKFPEKIIAEVGSFHVWANLP